MRKFLPSLVENRNLYLISVFAAYIIILFIFAAIYYGSYLRNPHNFAFNSDILSAQTEIFRSTAERDVTNYGLNLELLHQFAKEMGKNIDSPIQTGRWYDDDHAAEFLANEYRYVISMRIHPGGVLHGPPPPSYRFVVKDREGREIANIALPSDAYVKLPNNVEEAKSLAKHLIQHFETELKEIQRQLSTLSGRAPEVWSFWDFLYFSTITQTTVGYGDILPNSTRIRIIVVIQLLIGTVLLVVLINLVFSHRPALGSQLDRKDP